ncbi:hypothetical protein M413DRAFT_138477 [Hebeloma cylindrosporum]|uniref:Protein PBN1 n=1 Tax=Hebeloma cylindrosporum TaxID=76867 RepID=A0A0C3CC43_HEBCY|nr:hypothetical protein M413DRAFT_138477 [Hebeloma cylindrosporum h7]
MSIEMAYITSTLQPTKGFHPVSISTLHFPHINPDWDQCSLYLHYLLPSLLFVDTHELAQRNASYTFRHWGSRDLERPAHALPDEPSELLVNVNLQEASLESDGENGRKLLVEVPMHLRYAAPRFHGTETGTKEKPYEQVRVDLPQAFFRCPTSLSHPIPASPDLLSERVLASLPGVKEDNALILIPNSLNAPIHLRHPGGNQEDLSLVEPLTALTILACFLWLLHVSWRTAARMSSNSTRPKIA